MIPKMRSKIMKSLQTHHLSKKMIMKKVAKKKVITLKKMKSSRMKMRTKRKMLPLRMDPPPKNLQNRDLPKMPKPKTNI